METGLSDDVQVSDNALIDYVDGELFDGRIGSLDAHLRRKAVVAHPLRYALLYVVWENENIKRPELLERAELDDEDFETALRPLLDTNLIARVPAPDGIRGRRTYYRVTTLGRQEIEGDRHHILGDD